MEDEIGFATNKTIGIQAGDLVAREAMKLLDNRVGPKSRPTRLSTEVLQNRNRITFRLYDRAWFKDLIKETWDHRFLRSDYENWLKTKRLTHRLATRLRYEKSPEDKETNS